MPKNKGKGGKNRRRGKNENEQAKRELDLKDEGQEYGQVIKILGNGRVSLHCFDGKDRLGNIRGKLRKKVWINTNDIVLCGLRDFQDGKCDILQKYNPDEARRLKRQGHIPDTINIDDVGAQNQNDNDFISFANENDDDKDLLEDENAIAPQPDRYGGTNITTDYVNLDDEFTTSESESESDEEEEDFDNYANYDSSKNKKSIDIDNI